MATQTIETTETMERSEPKPEPPKRGFGRLVRRFIAIGGIVIIAIAVLFPKIAAYFLTSQDALQWVQPGSAHHLEVGHASLGWTSPVFLKDVKVTDDHGTEVATIASVNTNSSLWSLVMGRPQTTVKLDGIHVRLVVTGAVPDADVTFDLPAMIQRILNEPLPSPGRETKVVISDAHLELVDSDGTSLQGWSNVTAEYQFQRAESPMHQFNLIAPDANSEGQSTINASVTHDFTSSLNIDRVVIEMDSSQQPMTGLQPLFPEIDMTQAPLITGASTIELTRTRGESIDFKVNSTIQPEAAKGVQQTYEDGTVDIDASYSATTDRLDVSRLYAQVDPVLLDADGSITDVTKEANVQVAGTLKSPAEALAELIPEELRDEIKMEGMELTDLAFEGPLKPKNGAGGLFGGLKFRVSTTLKWKHSEAFGVVSDNGKIKISMVDNMVTLDPLDVPVSQGRVVSLPSIDLNTDPPTVHIADGLILDKVNLTEEMCRGWVGYVTPLAAGATSARGTISLSAKATSFQLGDIEKSQIAGVLTMHDAEIGPGPIVQPLLAKIGTIRQLARAGQNPNALGDKIWMKMDNQNIQYQIANGRAYHKDLTMHVGDMPISSAGSIGFDNTLDLGVRMSLPDKWFEGKPLLEFMQGESIDIPIHGTTKQPIIDDRGIANFGKRIGSKAAGGFLNKLLDGSLKLEPRTPRTPRPRPVPKRNR